MTFTSFNFLLFFPAVILFYNLIPNKWKVYFLLVVSYVFYINLQPIYAMLLGGVTLCTYLFARAIHQASSEQRQHRLMAIGIIATVLPLFFYKYFGAVNEVMTGILVALNVDIALPTITWMLPVGISFYTFMSIGYLVDVYNEKVEFDTNIARTGLFLSFFPIILSGPIERAENVLPQLKKLRGSTYYSLISGSKLMLWGYFMKLCVADRLCIYVDAVFNNIPNHNGTTLAFASILYPFQVYADLGGYSLLAIGAAKCMGIDIIKNFRRPFFSTSMSEFWRRWHISLIQWLTDYIYTPLSFSLRSWKMWGVIAALLLTFLISGLWHGATLTFILWGLIQGVYLSIEAATNKKRGEFEQQYNLSRKWWYILFWCNVTFLLFAFSQIFGRCTTAGDAFEVIRKIFTEHGELFWDMPTFTLAFPALLLLLFKDFKDEFLLPVNFLSSKYYLIRYLSAIALVTIIILFGVLDGGQFIYFQF